MLAWFLGSRLGRILQTLLVAAGFLFGAVMFGRVDQKKTSRIKDLQDYVDTQKKVASVAPSADSNAALDRMRHNGWIK